MRRTLVRLATATAAVLGATLVAAGPASASADQVPPPPSTTGDHDCGYGEDCHPGLHIGWQDHRNVGG